MNTYTIEQLHGEFLQYAKDYLVNIKTTIKQYGFKKDWNKKHADACKKFIKTPINEIDKVLMLECWFIGYCWDKYDYYAPEGFKNGKYSTRDVLTDDSIPLLFIDNIKIPN